MSVRFLEQDVEYVTFMGELLERFRFKGTRVWTRPRSGSLLYLTMTSNLEVKLYFTQSAADGIEIDWGDGSEAETVTETSANITHTYEEAGDYIISLSSIDGATWAPGGVLYNILGKEGGGKGYTSPELTEAVLDGAVTSLNSYAFEGCTSLSSITLPETLVTVNSNAFYGCTSLCQISLPDGVTTLAGSSFYGCTALEKLTVPSGVTVVNSSLCYGCSALRRVVLPEGITAIQTNAFYNCSALEEISIPATVTSIGTYAFFGCVSLPVNLELSVTTLGYSAFAKCTQLEKVWLRAAITTINAYEAKKDGAVTARYGPFLNCDASLVLYCEPASRPEGWNQYFNVYTGLDTRLSTQYGVADRPW